MLVVIVAATTPVSTFYKDQLARIVVSYDRSRTSARERHQVTLSGRT
jgi:hypothetical protein